jgi:hypothetical protein
VFERYLGYLYEKNGWKGEDMTEDQKKECM